MAKTIQSHTHAHHVDPYRPGRPVCLQPATPQTALGRWREPPLQIGSTWIPSMTDPTRSTLVLRIQLRTAIGHAQDSHGTELAFGPLDFDDYRGVFKFWTDGTRF